MSNLPSVNATSTTGTQSNQTTGQALQCPEQVCLDIEIMDWQAQHITLPQGEYALHDQSGEKKIFLKTGQEKLQNICAGSAQLYYLGAAGTTTNQDIVDAARNIDPPQNVQQNSGAQQHAKASNALYHQTTAKELATKPGLQVFIRPKEHLPSGKNCEHLVVELLWENIKCRLCKQELDSPPMQDKAYKQSATPGQFVCCDHDWGRKLKKLIDDGDSDIDILWAKLCAWHVAHNQEWNSRKDFIDIIDNVKRWLGETAASYSGRDNQRWWIVYNSLGLQRFGGRGELQYPSYDKFQHFIGGAYYPEMAANFLGDVVEVADVIKAGVLRLIGKAQNHHIGYDEHDAEWTWAGGAFRSTVLSLSDAQIEAVLRNFSVGNLVFSRIYTSVSRNRDPSPQYQNDPRIDSSTDLLPPSSNNLPRIVHQLNQMRALIRANAF